MCFIISEVICLCLCLLLAFFFSITLLVMAFAHLSFHVSISIWLICKCSVYVKNIYKFSLYVKNIFCSLLLTLLFVFYFFIVFYWLCFIASFLCRNLWTFKQCYSPVFILIASEFWYGIYSIPRASQVMPVVKNPPTNAGDIRDSGPIPRSGRSPGGGHSNPLQCSSLKNPTDSGVYWATVHRIAHSDMTGAT